MNRQHNNPRPRAYGAEPLYTVRAPSGAALTRPLPYDQALAYIASKPVTERLSVEPS